MTLQIHVRQGCLIVEMPAEVDISNAERLRAELRDVCRGRLAPQSKGRISSVVVDWSAAPFLTMAGTAVLEGFRQAVRETSTPFMVVVPKGLPRKVLHIVGWDEQMPLLDSLDQALMQARGVGDFGGSREPG
ncbi:STAS domain-containing protein [Streptomyces venezuelae]|uniref:STAS domain-containing protein n=1 Tax=Streptomyces venezuelae TaxID=54571 RepID=UPI003447D6B1